TLWCMVYRQRSLRNTQFHSAQNPTNSELGGAGWPLRCWQQMRCGQRVFGAMPGADGETAARCETLTTVRVRHEFAKSKRRSHPAQWPGDDTRSLESERRGDRDS